MIAGNAYGIIHTDKLRILAELLGRYKQGQTMKKKGLSVEETQI